MDAATQVNVSISCRRIFRLVDCELEISKCLLEDINILSQKIGNVLKCEQIEKLVAAEVVHGELINLEHKFVVIFKVSLKKNYIKKKKGE